MSQFEFSGRLIESETGRGIPDLQVVLYDLDSAQHNLSPYKNLSSGESAYVTSADFWQKISGQRIGSLITNPRGFFKFSFAEDVFARADARTPADLLFLVFAPERSREDSVYSDSPAQRLIHLSLDIRLDGGPVEQALIKIPREKLQKYGVTTEQGTAEPSFSPNILASSAESYQSMSAQLTTEKQKLATSRIVSLTKSRQAFKNFSLIGDLAEKTNFYMPGGPPFREVRDRILDESLRRIPGRESGFRRSASLELTREELEEFGLSVSPEGIVSGRASLADLLRKIRQQEVEWTEDSAGALRSYCERARVNTSLEDLETRCSRDSGAGDGSEEPGTEGEPSWDGSEELAKLMSSIAIPGRLKALEVESPTGEVTALIEKGASDTVAYHDFQEVQVAYENIWSAALDETMTPYLRSIYREMVGYQNKISGEEEWPEVESIDDMRRVYNEFIEFVDAVESDDEPRQMARPETEPVPPVLSAMLPEITPEIWNEASSSQKQTLLQKAEQYRDAVDVDAGDGAAAFFTFGGSYAADQARARNLQRDARDIVRIIERRLSRSRLGGSRSGTRPAVRSRLAGSRLAEIMTELDEKLAEPHRFDIFTPDSVNLGVMLSYRQKWEPEAYQVGELISTIPLSPGEVRSYSKQFKVSKSRNEKLTEEMEEKVSSESSSTQRADAEIVKAAKNNTSFEQTSNITIGMGDMFNGQFGTRFGVSAEKSTQSTKKNFREAVQKAAQEYKKTRKLEVTTTASEASEFEDKGQISNPNDEIAVTYLFYELQRRYQVSEKLHQITPVVMVANKVPSPAEIDEDWLIKHDWILRKVILDKTFLQSLDDVTVGWAGDELALEVLRQSMEQQLRLVEELTHQLEVKTYLAEEAFEELRVLMGMADNADNAKKMQDIALALAFGPLGLIGSRDDEGAEKREEVVKMAIDRADKEKNEVNARLSRELAALQEAIDKYTHSLRAHFDRQASIARLRLHIKDNILYYMQAIWDHEPSDQRFFRLYNVEVPWVADSMEGREVEVRGEAIENSDFILALAGESGYRIRFTLPFGAMGDGTSLYRRETRKLHEVANLDRLLGYKGNYMLFPAKELSYIHEYMSQDYMGPVAGTAQDPTRKYGYSREELLDFLCCLKKTEPAVYEDNREGIIERMREVASEEAEVSARVIVPTDSAFIEALPGTHPVMESFKVAHRALDVEKVKSELRKSELENLRYGLRLQSGDYSQPDFEKNMLIEGDLGGIVADP
ncbi:hypothetical protein [Microbulbifer sediminum]|uniref:hypothetical protein n=1 Tax=Microbulbifer sediminum TaxID=2904250 RepID=UPI001F1DCAE8|nr:hypothetical protein [Microbulbifer sediminum]